MIKKIFLNINFKILHIIGLKNFLLYISFIFLNLKKITKKKNLDVLNDKFKKISLNFYNKKFYFNIHEIDKLSFENNSFGLIREIFFRNIYFKFFKFLKPNEINCIDLGCNIGIFSVLASKFFKKIVSIDMNLKYEKPYNKIMLDNKVSNVVFLNCLVGNDIFCKKQFIQDSKILDFDELLISEKIDNIFLKIDIEGHEFKLFEKINLDNVLGISMEIHQNEGDIDQLINKISKDKFLYILTNDLSEIVNDKKQATYIYAAKKNSDIILKL
jgi:hypothetical protein